MYHMWVNQWMNLQIYLDCETFDPLREIVIIVDFAASYQVV